MARRSRHDAPVGPAEQPADPGKHEAKHGVEIMSTHATITLEAGENQLHLFRHYDGFPASCEADIATKALKEARMRCPFFDES